MAVSWDKFAAFGGNTTAEFESLSSIIFSDATSTSIGSVPINYPGLEAKPVKDSSGKYFGYQCKYFKSSNAKEKETQITHSLRTIKDEDLKILKKIYIFANECSDGVEKTCTKDWKTYLKSKGISNIPLEWHYGLDYFINYLRLPKFEGALSTYFGEGKPVKLLDSNVSEEFIQLRKQKYYIDIPVLFNDKRTNIQQLIKNKSKSVLIQSRAGTGKSWLMYEIAHFLGGHSNNYKKRLLDIHKNGLILRLTAHECSNGSVNDILTRHLNDYGIKPFDYPITLLIDAIDEVGREPAQYLSESLNKMLRAGQVKKVILTSRTASINSSIAISLLKPAVYDIDTLNNTEVTGYFSKRGVTKKTRLLRQAIKTNVSIEPIRSIRMLETSWSVINDISDFSLETIFKKAFDNELSKLQLSDLNMLEPINEGFESILNQQAYSLQRNEVFDFSLTELQEIILAELPRADYKDVNHMVELLKRVCLDSTSKDSKVLQFSNRSWVDYFTARYLAAKYIQGEKSSILEFAAYEDFINRWFIPIARKGFIDNGLLVKSIGLGVIEYYSNDDYSLSWVDKDAELLTDISYAKYDQNAVESLSQTIRGNSNLKVIRRAYDAGMHTQASFALNKLRQKLISSTKIPKDVWDDFTDYWYLRIALDKISATSALNYMQDIVEINIKKSNQERPEESDYSKRLVSLSNELVSLNTKAERILDLIKPNLVPYFFEFIIRPENIYLIRHDSKLQKKLKDGFDTQPDLQLIYIGLVEDEWSTEVVNKAGILLESINEQSSSSYFWPMQYNVKRLALLRILSYWKYDDTTYSEGPIHSTLTLNHIFNSLYSVFSYSEWQTEIEKFIKWISSEKFCYYDDNRNDSMRLKLAISDILSGFMVSVLPAKKSSELAFALMPDGKKVYSAYHTLLRVYKHDEDVFRNIFTYSDVKEIMESSRNDIADRQSTTSDFALIIGMFSSEDLLLFATNSKRDARLRYGYRKDIMGFFLTDALETVWRDRIYSIEKLKDYTWRVFRIILRILDITDGAETHWLPNYMFDVLCKYDMEFADEVYVQFLKDYDYENDSVKTIVIRGAIQRGDSYESIKKRLSTFRMSMLEAGRVVPSYYEEQIVCLGDILLSARYANDDKIDAFKKMSSYLRNLKKEAKATKWSYTPDSFSDKLKLAAKAYRSFRTSLPDSNDYESFPYPRHQKDSFSSTYKQKQKDEEVKAKKALDNATKQSDILEVIDSYMDYGYRYLLSSELGSKLFVQKLIEFSVPYEKIKPIISRAIEEHYYGRKSRLFVKEMWKSTYKNELLNTLAKSMHHSDLTTVLYLFSTDNDINSIKELISETTSIIELLTRQDLSSYKDQ